MLKNVVVLEDSLDDISAYVTLFRRTSGISLAGLAVRGYDLESIIRECQSDGVEIHAVVLDGYVKPSNHQSEESTERCVRRVQALLPDAPIIAASSSSNQLARLVAAGCTHRIHPDAHKDQYELEKVGPVVRLLRDVLGLSAPS